MEQQSLLVLLKDMTLEEKIGQLIQVPAAMLGENTTCLSPEKAAGRCLDALESLARDLQVPRHLVDYGVTPDDVPVLAESVLQVTRLLGNNPRSVSLQDAINIYREAL